MIRPPASDFWQVGVVPVEIADCLAPGRLQAERDRVVWLPDPGPWRYLADPFGVRRGEATHVFVEAFDYRTKHAVIEHHELGPGFVWRGKSTVLARPFHLSYPFIIEDAGEVFMVPESHRGGEIALYRAKRFPDEWIRETALIRDVPGAEPSLIRHHGRWWMFFTIVGPNARDQKELHVAHADLLTGPWVLHPQNPILTDRAGARPGGTPFVGADGAVILPVQDCSESYGGALRFVTFPVLEPGRITVERLGPRLTGGGVSDSHREGFHTLAACSGLTLIDAKRIVRLWARHGINLRRRFVRRQC